jgi:hypothetical protein
MGGQIASVLSLGIVVIEILFVAGLVAALPYTLLGVPLGLIIIVMLGRVGRI